MTRIRTDVRWSMVPEWVSDYEQGGLSHAAVRLYAILMRYANSEGEGAVPARATLAKRMGLKTTDRVDAAKKELLAAGALEVFERPGKPNEYRLHQVPRKLPRVENSVGTLPRKLDTNENQNEKDSPDGESAPQIERPRDLVWDALVDRFGPVADRTNAHAKRNKAVRDLKRLGATVESVEAALKAWPRLFENAQVTDVALATHYPQLLQAAGWKEGRERAKPCPECGVGGGLHVADCPKAAVAA